MIVEAKGLLRLETQNLRKAWCLVLDGERYPLNPWGRPDKLQALHFMTSYAVDVDNRPLPLDRIAQTWKSLSAAERTRLLRDLIGRVPEGGVADEEVELLETLKAEASVEIERIRTHEGGTQ
jgi:hypothetical protein